MTEPKSYDLSDTGTKRPPMKIYATIRDVSKYSNQQPKDKKGKPVPFEITFAFESDPLWPVKGGIGGNYTLYDVDLWFFQGGRYVSIPVHDLEDKYLKVLV